jgi:hypothetical protein
MPLNIMIVLELDETYIDRLNRETIRQKIDKIQINKIEDADIYKTPDPFTRLLKRASVQLLSSYKDSEIPSLDKGELYLLRNAIYGRHGYKFDTPNAQICQPQGLECCICNFQDS